MTVYTKIILCVAGAATLASYTNVVLSRRAVHGALVAGVEQSAAREVESARAALGSALLAGDEGRLLPLLQEYSRTTGAVYAYALDGRGRVLGHTNVAEVGRVHDDAETAGILKSRQPSGRERRLRGQPVLDVAVPVFAEAGGSDEEFMLAGGVARAEGARAGTLRAGLPLAQTLAVEDRIAARIVQLSAFVGLLAGVLIMACLRRFLAPIPLLAAATEQIRRGDYRASIPVTTGDEFGALATSFNAMSRELDRTTVSKDSLHGILDGIQDYVIVTDAAGIITLLNPAASQGLGYGSGELLGRRAALLLDEPEVPFTAASRDRGVRFRCKNGEALEMLLSTTALTDSGGRVTGYIGSAKDVSGLKKLEARMRQSEKLSAVGQLAAGVAHEINNPLGVILGFSQGLSRRLKAGDPLELPVRSIEREALRCKVLVQNLLTFARTSRSDRSAMSLNDAVEQALALVQPQAKIARVLASARLGGGLPLILGNKNQIEQIVMNLAKNAIDAMPQGGALTLSTELVVEAPHSWVCLRVADDGEGIPRAVLGKIFDPFFTTKVQGQGTGLGLSLVSEIVQKHSGDVSVESRPGRTVFTVRFPARTGSELERKTEALHA